MPVAVTTPPAPPSSSASASPSRSRVIAAAGVVVLPLLREAGEAELLEDSTSGMASPRRRRVRGRCRHAPRRVARPAPRSGGGGEASGHGNPMLSVLKFGIGSKPAGEAGGEHGVDAVGFLEEGVVPVLRAQHAQAAVQAQPSTSDTASDTAPGDRLRPRSPASAPRLRRIDRMCRSMDSESRNQAVAGMRATNSGAGGIEVIRRQRARPLLSSTSARHRSVRRMRY